jgi:phage antirepressor YoqD-like protein
VLEEIKSERDKRKALENENRHNRGLIALMECKVSYYDTILQNTDTIPISKIAKDYGMTASALNRLLHEEGIQYPFNDTWLLYQKYAKKGYTHSYTYMISPSRAVVHTNWTQKGRLFLYYLLKGKGILPMIERRDQHESAHLSNR